MTVAGVTSGDAAVRFLHESDRLVLTLPSAPAAGDLRRFTVKYRGIPASGLKAAQEQIRRALLLQCRLARPGASVAAHRRSSVRQSDRASFWSPPPQVPGGRQRFAGGGNGPGQWPPHDSLETIGADRHVALQCRDRSVRVTDLRTAAGVPLQTWVNHQDRDAGIGTFEEPMRQAIEFYHRPRGPYPYEKLATCNGQAGGGGMEHASAIFYGRARGHRATGNGPGGARDRPPVVRRFRDREGLGRRMAERRLRHLLRPADGGTL